LLGGGQKALVFTAQQPVFAAHHADLSVLSVDFLGVVDEVAAALGLF
jgi:hypothetical protein